MYRRRRKKSLGRKLLTWSFLLLLCGWSYWQLRQIQEKVSRTQIPDASQVAADTDDAPDAQTATENTWAAPAQVMPTSAIELADGDPFSAGISAPIDLLPTPVFDPAMTSDELLVQGTQQL